MAQDINTQTSVESTLSQWAGPYITDMLGKAQALSEVPYQPYTGALTATPSSLQSQAFQGIGALTVPQNITQAGQTLGTYATKDMPAYQPGTYSPIQFSQENVQQYMNPYLESVLEPQRREAQRQADIARTQMQSRRAQAGAYGGSRQAIMEAENQRNLQTLLGDITGKGYSGAFEDASKRLAEENARGLEAAKFGEQSRQFGTTAGLDTLARQIQAAQAQAATGGQEAQYGLANIAQQLAAGQTQRDIEQQGLSADLARFEKEEAYPREQLQFLRQMISGIPGLATQSYYTAPTDPFAQAASGASSLMALMTALGIVGKK